MSDFPQAECKERVRRLTEREREVLRCLDAAEQQTESSARQN